jgi:tyrosinase
MSRISRRSLLAASALGAAGDAIPFSSWIKQQAWAQGTRVRYNAYSSQGKAMLVKYKDAVARMMNTSVTPEQSPLSWTFQWYTHWCGPGKANELNRIYPHPSPERTLADEMWNTCQAHGPGEREDFFLPWHRMFVYYFETIVRQMSSDPSFTLPYWNYSNAAQGAIPSEFAVTSSPLYRANRNPGVNTGAKIPPSYVVLTALDQKTYSPSGAAQGFCATLDFGIHGNVHVWVGDGTNMGSVPWAARDPIFWMHHCNIDRLWASWNRGNCKNPTQDNTWMDKQFIFADAQGKRVVATVRNFDDIAKLGYTYAEFEPASCPATIARVNPAVLASLASPTQLARTPLHLNLAQPAAPAPGARATALNEQIRSLGDKNVYLVLQNVQAEAAPGVVYNVYLDLPQGASPSPGSPNFVGTINFFGVTMTGADMQGMTPRTFSLDVTDKIKALQAGGGLGQTPAVTLVPQGEAAENARATIGRVELVSQ